MKPDTLFQRHIRKVGHRSNGGPTGDDKMKRPSAVRGTLQNSDPLVKPESPVATPSLTLDNSGRITWFSSETKLAFPWLAKGRSVARIAEEASLLQHAGQFARDGVVRIAIPAQSPEGAPLIWSVTAWHDTTKMTCILIDDVAVDYARLGCDLDLDESRSCC